MKNATSSSPTATQLERKLAAADAENVRLLALMEKKEAQWEATKQSLFEQFPLIRPLCRKGWYKRENA